MHRGVRQHHLGHGLPQGGGRRLDRRGLAIWDVYAACEREGSLDTAIRNAELNDFGLVRRDSHPVEAAAAVAEPAPAPEPQPVGTQLVLAFEAISWARVEDASGKSLLSGVIAAGVESMSRVPMGSDGGAWAMDPATALQTGFVPQGIGADTIATLEGFSRQDVDAFALRSQQRAKKAWSEKRFAKSVVAVKDLNGLTVLDHDEFIRPGTTVETLGNLKPAFKPDGKVTAGNSSQITDGASAVLIMDEDATVVFTQALMERFHCPTILDAEAMSVLSSGTRPGGPITLTPHAGEMAHLTGRAKSDVVANAQALAAEYLGLARLVFQRGRMEVGRGERRYRPSGAAAVELPDQPRGFVSLRRETRTTPRLLVVRVDGVSLNTTSRRPPAEAFPSGSRRPA